MDTTDPCLRLLVGCFFFFSFLGTVLAQHHPSPINNPDPQSELINLLDSIRMGEDKEVPDKLNALLARTSGREDSLHILYEVGRAYVKVWEKGQGETAPAKKYLSQAIALGMDQNTQNLKAYLALGIIFKEEGHLEEALLHYEQAVRQFSAMQGPEAIDSLVAGYAYENAGKIYTRHGDYEKAVAFFRKSLRIGKAKKNHRLIEGALIELGTATNFMGDPKATIEYYEEALQYPRLSEKNKLIAMINLGSALVELNELGQAQGKVEEVIDELKERSLEALSADAPAAYQTYESYLLDAFNTQGIINRRMGRSLAAEQAFQQALIHGKNAYQANRSRKIAKVQIQLAEMLFEKKRFEEAINACQTALQGVLPDMKEDAVPVLPELGSFYPEPVILEALEVQANCFHELYERDRSEIDLMLAMRSHQLANASADLLRQAVDHESSKLLLADETHRRAEKAIEVAYELYRKNREQKYWEMAFEFAEKSKANLLMESLQDQQARFRGGIPAELLGQEQRLQHQLVNLEQELRGLQLQRPLQPQALASAEDQLFQTRQQYEQLLESLEQQFPEYHQLKYRTETARMTELQTEYLKGGEALISFFYGDRFLYCFLISQTEYILLRQPLDKGLNDQISALSQSITSLHEKQKAQFPESAFQLYRQLLAPLPLKPYRRLFIVPDRQLALIPFELLLSREVEQDAYWASYPFVIKDHVISYGYSASMLLHTQRRAKGRDVAPKAFLGMAPGNFEAMGLAPLPHTLNEVIALQRKMGGKSLTGPQASQEAFMQSAGEFQVLHLSTHATAWDSLYGAWIALSNEEGKASPLYLDELAALRLKADLTVLSACETGTGSIQRGEGVMSLARAFTFAGSQATIQSLWPVRATAAEPLMEAFYQHLSQGLDKAEALQKAKLELLASPGLAEPVMWAAFVAIGDMAPMRQGKKLAAKSLTWTLLVLGLALLAGGGVWWRKRNLAKA